MTDQVFMNESDHSKIYPYFDLIDGTQKSSCPMPCSTIQVESRLLQERLGEGNKHFVDMQFSKGIPVTKTKLKKFNFAILLSEIGGSMGLWLGLGLLQVLEISIKFILSTLRKWEIKDFDYQLCLYKKIWAYYDFL